MTGDCGSSTIMSLRSLLKLPYACLPKAGFTSHLKIKFTLQKQTAVIAYFSSVQLLQFNFTQLCPLHVETMIF